VHREDTGYRDGVGEEEDGRIAVIKSVMFNT